MPGHPRILIVDDDVELAADLATYLEQNGIDVDVTHDVASARRVLPDTAPDLCLVDIVMPGLSGRVFCKDVVESSDAGVIMMSSLSDSDTIIALLEIGADDYIVKPFRSTEVLARARAVLRRRDRAAPVVAVTRLGPWAFELENRQLRHDEGFTVALTPSEAEILRFMAASPGTVFSRADILAVSRNRQHGGAEDRAVDNLIKRLRRKIEDDPANARYVVTVYGKGFRLNP